MTLSPEQYTSVSPYELLIAAARGVVGVDHRLLRAIVDRPEEAIRDLLRFHAEPREIDRINIDEDLYAIARHLADPRLLPFLIEHLRREREEPPEDLAGAFAAIGALAIEPLLGLYDELGEEEGGEVLFVLTLLRVRDDRIFARLRDFLEFSVPEGAFLLGVYGDSAAIPLIEAALAKWPELARDISPALTELRQPRSGAPPDSATIWDIYPESLGPVFDVLDHEERLELLASSSEDLRHQAALSFLDQDLEPSAAGPLLALARQDPSERVRGAAWAALGNGVEDAGIKSAILERLDDVTAPEIERCGALIGLALEPNPVVASHVLSFYDRPSTRGAALEAMWRSLNRSYARYMARHMDDEDETLRRHAIKGAGFLEMVSEAGRLRELLDDDEYRLDALFSYALVIPARLSGQGPVQLLNQVEEDAGGLSELEEDLVEQAIDLRLMRHGREPVFHPLEDEEDEEEEDERIVETAPAPPMRKVGRNEPCPCGSGRKYKKCCGA